MVKKVYMLMVAALCCLLPLHATDLYVLGDIDGINGFFPDKGLKMTQVNDNNWQIAVTINNKEDGYGYFAFTHQLAESWAAMGNNQVTPWTDNILISPTSDIVKCPPNPSSNNESINSKIKCLAGGYLIKVEKTPWYYAVTVEEADMSKELFVIGWVNGETGWDLTKGVKLEWSDEVGAYAGRITTTEEDNYFTFTTKLASTSNDWDEIQDSRVGMVSDGNWWLTEERLGDQSAMASYNDGGQTIKAPAGTWDLFVDLAAMKLTINRLIPRIDTPKQTNLDVMTTFNLKNTDGWAYDYRKNTATRVQKVIDPYGKEATFTFTATDKGWTPTTWKSFFDAKYGMNYRDKTNSTDINTSFTVTVEHKTGEYTHYFNMIDIKWGKLENGEITEKTIGNLNTISSMTAGLTQLTAKFGTDFDVNIIER